jgi:hypothetical protein
MLPSPAGRDASSGIGAPRQLTLGIFASVLHGSLSLFEFMPERPLRFYLVVEQFR